MEQNKSNLPIIIESDTSNLDSSHSATPPSSPAPKKGPGSWFGRIIFGLLASVILVEIIVGFRVLKTPIPEPGEVQAIGGGKLLLVAAVKDYQVGETIPVTIGVSTGTKSAVGIDVVIKYDPRVLEASNSAFIKGSLFPEYPLARIDGQSGTIEVSGISSVNQAGFLGAGVFGKLNFKAKAIGNTEVKFVYTVEKTDDSNIINGEDSTDMLEQVSNLKLNIK